MAIDLFGVRGLMFGLACVALVACKGEEPTDTGDTNDDDTDVEDPGETEDVCDDGEDDDGDGDVDCDDDDCEEEDACRVFVVKSFVASGAFGYDAETDAIIDTVFADSSGNPVVQPPVIAIELRTEDYAPTQTDPDSADVCVIQLTAKDDAVLALESLGDGHFGFKLEEGDYDMTTDCTAEEGKALDPEFALGATPEDVAAWGWGVGLGEMDAQITTALTTALDDGDDSTPVDLEPYAGAGFWTSAMEGQEITVEGYFDLEYGVGLAINAEGEVLNEDGEPLANDEDAPQYLLRDDVMNATTELPSGSYLTLAAGVIQFQ